MAATKVVRSSDLTQLRIAAILNSKCAEDEAVSSYCRTLATAKMPEVHRLLLTALLDFLRCSNGKGNSEVKYIKTKAEDG